MCIKPSVIAPAINIAMAQRLVRKLCPECRQKTKAKPEQIKKIREVLKNLPPKVEPPQLSEEITIYEAKGCQECNLTGYRDRIGLFEAFIIDKEIEQLILKSPAISEIRDLILKKEMVTMLQDGYLKILEGATDFNEIERVLGV